MSVMSGSRMGRPCPFPLTLPFSHPPSFPPFLPPSFPPSLPSHPSPFSSQTDIDRSGEIEYGEFLAATLHLSKIEKQENLLKAFQYFDADGSGAITMDELQKACEEMQLSKGEIQEMMKEIDKNNVSVAASTMLPSCPSTCQDPDSLG